MAVVPMKRVRLCAMKRDRKAILELLQRRGVIEVRDAGDDDDIFSKTDTSPQRAIFLKNAATAREAVEILDKAAPQKGAGLAFLRGRVPVRVADSAAFGPRCDKVLHDAGRIIRLRREAAEAKAGIMRCEALSEALIPWLGLPVAQTFSGTRKTAVFIGSLDGEWSLEKLTQELALRAPGLTAAHAEIISADKSICRLLLMVLKKDAKLAEDALRSLGFARPSSAGHQPPQIQQSRLSDEISEAAGKIADCEAEIASMAGRRGDLCYFEDYMTMRAEKYAIIAKLRQTRHVFVLEGYLPHDAAQNLEAELTGKYQCAVEFTAAEAPGGEVPVLLKNNWFAEPLTGVLQAYSLPGKGEIDPVGVMAVFYYFMFGLMFSDAAYGAIMFGVCLFCLLRFKNMEPNWSRNIRMFMWCGLSTLIWGVVFSSYFGDAVDVVSRTFFGREAAIPPLWFSPMEQPMLLLMFCLSIGLIHLTVSFVMKGITCAKNGDYPGIVYDMVFPILSWYPLVLLLMGSELFVGMAGFRLMLPAAATPVCLAIVAAAIVGIVFTGGRESKSWGKRILKGIYAVYSTLSGWLSDILSYSRLLALGLATGVIASVMNQMGTLAGGGVVGAILFIVVFCVGQALNFGINVLGAYVHSNRLEYVECFGKFYSGGGEPFAPFGIHTKHYKIVEEESSL